MCSHKVLISEDNYPFHAQRMELAREFLADRMCASDFEKNPLATESCIEGSFRRTARSCSTGGESRGSRADCGSPEVVWGFARRQREGGAPFGASTLHHASLDKSRITANPTSYLRA